MGWSRCFTCGKEFSREDNLRRHHKDKHPEVTWESPRSPKQYPCDLCSKIFRYEANFVKHRRTHPSNAADSFPTTSARQEGIDSSILDPSSLQEDPLDYPSHLGVSLEEDVGKYYETHWKEIRSRKKGGKYVDVYSFRLDEPTSLDRLIKEVFRQQTAAFKMNVAFGFILRNTETGEVRFYYPSQNGFLFDEPVLIANQQDLDEFLEKLGGTDWREFVSRQKPNSKWQVSLICNAGLHIYKLTDQPIGRGKRLPSFIVENRGIDALETNHQTGQLYEDNLCYFRCLARHKGYHLKNLERKAKQLHAQYLASLPESQRVKEDGIKLSDLYRLDKLFGIHAYVYCLNEDQSVELVHRPATMLTKQESAAALKLNLYQEHFSFIKDMSKYSRCFTCQRCGGNFFRPWRLIRHERSCNAKIKYVYPGGVFHLPKSIFDRIEDESIEVEEDLKFSKYRATFDIEVFYPRDANLPEKRKKLEFKAQHSLLSVSVASNVPGYEEAKCFVVKGEGRIHEKETVTEFIQHLEDIAQEAADLELARFSDLMATVEETLCPGGIAPYEEEQRAQHRASQVSTSQEIGECTGFDDDDDDDTDWESEEEETDLEFIDDEELEESTDPSFYRRLNHELDEKEEEQIERQSNSSPRPEHAPNRQLKKAKQLVSGLRQHIGELVVVGFNSGKYDLNVLKDVLIPHLVNNQGIKFVVQKNQAYLALRSGTLKFLDVTNFLAAGSSYAAFLKAYDCSVKKACFPYEYVDSLDKLQEPQLPPHSAFYSWLRKSNITREEYAECQRAWEREGMRTLKDFLVWYNNIDVLPFLEALEKMCKFWRSKKIDMLKAAISLPALAFKFEMSFLKEQGLHLSAFDTEELYQLFKDNMVGGPAIIFHRYAEINKSKIRENEYGEAAKTVKKIVGYDANALYLWALCQPMPVGLYMSWKLRGHDLHPSKSWKDADEWLAWEAHKRGIPLRTRLDEGEQRLGPKQLPVDGYHSGTNTAFEYDGCWWHGHSCLPCHPRQEQERLKRAQNTREKKAYLESLPGVTLVSKRECEWHQEYRSNRVEIDAVLNEKFPGRGEMRLSESAMLERVMNDTFFGALEVDIQTPEELKETCSEMTPIFKNVAIHRQDVGEHMKQFAEEREIMSTPRRSLIGSYFGDKILLGTPLLKYYLQKGLKVTKVYRAVQWTPHPWLQPFGEFVSSSRRAADADVHQKILGETAKTVGNAGFGRFLMDVARHQEVKYEKDQSKVARNINSFFFRDLQELSEGVFELKMGKKRVKMNLPIQIGFFVFTYAKLRMLQFYYDCIDKYLDRADFQYLEMDTDSAYMALAGESIEELVKPELRAEFAASKHLWFPRRDTPENAAYDKRTPGLFKVEWSGEGFVGLNSKTYCCWGQDEGKVSCKGISKRLNKPTKEVYLDVLQSKQSQCGENRGFRIHQNQVFTYTQHRTGFQYFYPKRKVQEDGIATLPLDL